MESHERDPRADEPDDPWLQAGERFTELTERLRERYRSMAGDDAPSEEQIREALQTLGSAAETMVESVGDAARDPQVRSQVKDAAAGFVSAIGQTLAQLGDELRRDRGPREEGAEEE